MPQTVSNKKLRLAEFNKYDIERTLRENVYDLQMEDIRIDAMVSDMVQQRIPVSIIIKWLRQLEDNAAEIVYLSKLIQNDSVSYNYSESDVLREERRR